MSENSTWTALRNPVFRNIWLASLISGTCVAAQDTAATWSMNRVSTSPLFLSLMATVASLPFFFFTLPAGALADMVDRKRMMFVMTVWLAIAAGGLALTGWFHLINPWILLIAVFLIGTGFAFYSPAWTSLQPEIVSNDELPSAATLGGLQLNISGIIGPAIGGVLLGSVLGAVFILPWARARLHSNTVTLVANILVAVVFFMMATIRKPMPFMVAAGLAGTAWTMAASELWVAGQRAMPSWARGRMNATIIMAAQGAMALGGIVWGTSVSMWGVKWTLLVACILQLGTLLLQLWLSIDFTGKLDFEPAPVAGSSYKLIHIPAPHDGPVAVMIDIEVDRTLGRDMLDVLREVRLIRLRNGAFSWRLHEDLGRPNTYRVELMYPSWTEFLLMEERMTKSEREIIEKARGYHVGDKPAEYRHFLCVNRELQTQRRPVTRPTAIPEAPLAVDRAPA